VLLTPCPATLPYDYVHSIYGKWTDKRAVPMRFRLATADKDGNLKAAGYDAKQLVAFTTVVAELQDEAQAITEVLKGKSERAKIKRR
jgi:predicted S18 family serine protease